NGGQADANRKQESEADVAEQAAGPLPADTAPEWQAMRANNGRHERERYEVRDKLDEYRQLGILVERGDGRRIGLDCNCHRERAEDENGADRDDRDGKNLPQIPRRKVGNRRLWRRRELRQRRSRFSAHVVNQCIGSRRNVPVRRQLYSYLLPEA